MRTLVVVLRTKRVERALLPSHRPARRRTGSLLQCSVHPLMAPVLLRLSKIDPLELDAELEPPRRELGESSGCVRRRERLTVVRPDRLRQTVPLEELDEHTANVLESWLVEANTRQKVPRRRVHHSQRVTEPPVTHRELAFEVDAPHVIRLVA